MRFHRQLQNGIAALGLFLALVAATPAQTVTTTEVHGRIGQVLDAAPVYSKPDEHSHTYFTTQPDQYLFINTDAPEGWIKVLLSTGKFGYVTSDAIKPLDVAVKAPVRTSRRVTVASRSSASLRALGAGDRAAAADRGLDFIGTPYKWGGEDITNGIDCSGFVQKLFGSIGVDLPRTAAEQAGVGTPITRLENLRKGDRLYFWEAKRGKIGHTGIYLGGGMFVHSSSGHNGVNVDDLRKGNWLKILVAARR